MGNARKLKRAAAGASKKSATPVSRTPTRVGGTPGWVKYAAIGAVAAVLGLVIVFIASDISNNPQGVAEPPEGAESFAVQDATHVDGAVSYPQDPPVGGPHNSVWLQCRAYDEPVPNENAVHSLEHGAVWITYQPGLDDGAVSTLEGKTRRREIIVSPYPGLASPVVASAWGRQLRVDSADDPRIDQFISAFQDQVAPEIAATC